MIAFLTPDIISAICECLRAVDIRALMITCRNIHAILLPLVKVRTSVMTMKTPRGLELTWTTKYMNELGINISTDIEIVNFDIAITPSSIPINYTGKVRISHAYDIYDMVLRDGIVNRYVKRYYATTSTDGLLVRFSGLHIVQFINTIYHA